MRNLIILACMAGMAGPVSAEPQAHRSAKRENRAETRDVDARMGRTIAAVTAAESRGKVSERRANEMRDMIDRMRDDYSRNKKEQGFVSAGELASYNRSLDQVDREITRR